jgi:hypothetical protein
MNFITWKLDQSQDVLALISQAKLFVINCLTVVYDITFFFCVHQWTQLKYSHLDTYFSQCVRLNPPKRIKDNTFIPDYFW